MKSVNQVEGCNENCQEQEEKEEGTLIYQNLYSLFNVSFSSFFFFFSFYEWGMQGNAMAMMSSNFIYKRKTSRTNTGLY